jgi:hypothetical protein
MAASSPLNLPTVSVFTSLFSGSNSVGEIKFGKMTRFTCVLFPEWNTHINGDGNRTRAVTNQRLPLICPDLIKAPAMPSACQRTWTHVCVRFVQTPNIEPTSQEMHLKIPLLGRGWEFQVLEQLVVSSSSLLCEKDTTKGCLIPTHSDLISASYPRINTVSLLDSKLGFEIVTHFAN